MKRIEEKNMEKEVLETIKKYNLIENGDKLVLAVSGGPDSISMLNILNKIKNNKIIDFDFCVAHVNHMIREEAKEDERYVENYCEKNGIEFYSKSIDVRKLAHNNKIGTEEAGRIARYDFFDEIAKKEKANKIAIAHNKNDKVETVIMNILRGSGISGLKGIEAKSGKYIRPLIECKRDKIEEYCEKEKLEPRIDKTNFENIYTRNKIRNIIIPYIESEFNPNIVETISRLSELVGDEDDYIEKQVEKKYCEIVEEENEKEIIIDLKKFNFEEKVIKSRIIIYTITRLLKTSKGISKIHIDDIIKLCNNNIGNKYLTPNKNVKILIKNHKIYFIKEN